MERLLVLQLESVNVAAEALINGVPVARTGPGLRVATVAIHEYTLSGGNELELVIQPPPPGAPSVPEPWVSDGHCGASLRLLLPRTGQLAHPENARTLALLEWAPVAEDVSEVPASVRRAVDLPIAFPRWRWLEAPVVDDPQSLRAPIAAYLQGLAVGLMRGDVEPLLLAARLRLEDLAQAYQRSLADDVGRLRLQVQQLHARSPLKPVMPKADTLCLRAVAGGRLLECLTPEGTPALQSPLADGGRVEWPVRVAVIEGRFYVLR